MKRILPSVLFALCVLSLRAQVEPPFNLPPDYEWVAPDWPAGEAPYWYDYGWDSTSNGPVPAGQIVAQATPPAETDVHRATRLLASTFPAVSNLPLQLAAAQKPPTPRPPDHQDRPLQVRPLQVRGKDKPGQFYSDQFIGVATPDFKDTSFTYGLGVGYQVSPHWGFDARISHHGLDYKGSAVQDIGGRLVARMPFRFLSPYTFIGGEFDLERDQWHILPGAGIEITPSKTKKRLALFTEGAIRADLKGRNNYQFLSGLRWRF